MKNLISFFLVLIFAAIIFVGCEDVLNNPINEPIPATGVSYSRNLQPLFELKCNYSGCHNDQSKAGGLALTSYFNTTRNSFVVIAGDPDGSLLVQKIRTGHPIDMNYPSFKSEEVNAVVTWIKEGAKNN